MNYFEQLIIQINEIDVLINNEVNNSAPEFIAWKSNVERVLEKAFGTKSTEYRNFMRLSFSSMFLNETCSINACKNGLLQSKALLETFLKDLKVIEEKNKKLTSTTKQCNNKVFIVHGHDDELKQEVARLIEKQCITTVILSEQANEGRTITTKFEDYSDVGGAICLFTADDICCSEDDSNKKKRARQNVVFETGYFIGKLGRKRVIILADKGIEMPSDLSGVVYTSTVNWQVGLLKELNAIGYNVDLNKLL